MEDDAIGEAYGLLCGAWEALSPADRALALDRFKVGYSFNSGNIENPEITYHDTEEVFDKGGVSNFTGDVRTIYEMNNLKRSWEWLMEALGSDAVLTADGLLEMHRLLTAGTYDDARWAKGERPGSFKKGDYRVADDVGLEPAAVPEAVEELMEEVRGAVAGPRSESEALTIAAYAHAKLVDIHPFADGNGRVARLLMNYVLLALGMPPCSVNADDRLAYFGALDCFHEEGDLEPFKIFLMVQTLKAQGMLGLAGQ